MAVGSAYVLLGLSLVVAPHWIVSAEFWGSRQGLLTAAAIRVVVGVALLLAASSSKYPRTFRVFGSIALLAGLIMPLTPLDFWAEYIHWWIVENTSVFRWTLATAGTLFGAFVVYGALPRRATT